MCEVYRIERVDEVSYGEGGRVPDYKKGYRLIERFKRLVNSRIKGACGGIMSGESYADGYMYTIFAKGGIVSVSSNGSRHEGRGTPEKRNGAISHRFEVNILVERSDEKPEVVERLERALDRKAGEKFECSGRDIVNKERRIF